MNAVASVATPGATDAATLERVLRAVRCVAWRVRLPGFVTLYVSANCGEILGHPAETWSDHDHWLAHVHPADRPRVLEQLATALASGHAFEREYRMTRADGTLMWVHDTIGFELDAEGRPLEMQGMTVDVTERRNREDELRFDRERMRVAIEVAGVSVWEWHVDSDRVVADPLGRPLIAGQPWRNASAAEFLSHVHPEDRDRMFATAMRAIATGEPYVATFRLSREDGSARWVETHVRPQGTPGRWHSLVGAARDVTEQTEALNEVRLRSLLVDSLGEGVTVTRGDGTIVYVNAAVERMFGYAAGELIGRDAVVLSARTELDYRRRKAEIIAQVERHGAWSGTVLDRRKDGTPLQTVCTITRVAVGDESLWIVARRDVTDGHQIQREVLAASQREKEALAQALHEGLAQQLSGIALLAGTLRDDGERRGSPIAGSLRRLAELLQDSVGTCRRLAQGVSGFVVRQGGLQIGLRELALAYERRCDACCDVDIDQSVSDALDSERARHLYWIAEDALNVAVELDVTSAAHLRLDRVEHCARLAVSLRDVPAVRLRADAAALKLIGYRAGLLGAGLATMPSADGGVTLEILCPLEDRTGATP